MAAPLVMTVARLEAGPYNPTTGPCVSTTNSQGRVVLATVVPLLEIWNVYIANLVKDPTVTGDGSFYPVSILLPTVPTPTWRLPLTVTVNLTGNPTGWTSNRGIVYGNLRDPITGLLVPILEGNPFVVTSPAAPQVAVLTDFRLVTARRFMNPIQQDYQFAIPFRASGDWVWTIQDAGVAVNPVPVVAAVTTRMELNFVVWPAPGGPGILFPATPILRSQADLMSSYPVPVQRESGKGTFQSRYILSSSSHGMAPFGGTFLLKTWINPPNPNNHYVNDFDLAAVLQLGCAVTLGITGNELFDSRWIVQSPFGYLVPGQMFGERATSTQCNNPYWNTGDWNPSPNVANPYDPTRTGFIVHTWIEVRLNRGLGIQTYVIDPTHALAGPTGVPAPESGTNTRATYLASHRDPNYPAMGANFFHGLVHNGRVTGNSSDWDIGNLNADCYSNPATRLPRIGVFGTDLQPPNFVPTQWTSGNGTVDAYFPIMKAPKILASSMEAVKGGEDTAAPGLFSNASLSAQTLLKLIDTAGTACIIFHDIRPALDRTTLHMVVTLPLGQKIPTPRANGNANGNDNSSPSNPEDDTTVQDTDSGPDDNPQMTIQIVAYSSAAIARDDVDTFLSLYSNLKHATKSETLGDVPMPAEAGVAQFVRGNVTATLTSDNPRAHVADLPAIASRIDKHIAEALVDDVAVRRGRVLLTEPVLARVVKGRAFTIRTRPLVDRDRVRSCGSRAKSQVQDVFKNGLDKVGDVNRVLASVSDPTRVVCTGPSERDGMLVFVPFEIGVVAITFVRPHHETLMPGLRRVVVEVVGEAEEDCTQTEPA
ncbi:hypothetical protein MFIFM68171_06282 [Madurella fahalii]|uniref:Uncharacterized protein n=1 Tax=Madurella fahalii TaxID=1157608 RepID=A0ABQ0GE85_9PEZI